MIYKFVLLSDEVDDFRREILIDSEATFQEFHDCILQSVGYSADQMTSFLLCEDDWEIKVEVTEIPMDTSSDQDSYTMEDTTLEELISEKGQKVMFVFDVFNERSFYMELKDIKSGLQPAPICKVSKGTAPSQLLDSMFMDDAQLAKLTASATDDSFNDEFQDEEGYNDDDFSQYNMNENYFEE